MLTEKDNAVQANAMETAVSADVSTRISQQLAELDEAYLHRAEKHIELLLAEKAADMRCGGAGQMRRYVYERKRRIRADKPEKGAFFL